MSYNDFAKTDIATLVSLSNAFVGTEAHTPTRS